MEDGLALIERCFESLLRGLGAVQTCFPYRGLVPLFEFFDLFLLPSDDNIWKRWQGSAVRT